jgi:hypothetical protein
VAVAGKMKQFIKKWLRITKSCLGFELVQPDLGVRPDLKATQATMSELQPITMIKTSLALLATATALGLAATAHADLTWDWSYTAILGAFPVSGGGTLTTGPESGGAYPVTTISGSYFTAPGAPFTILGLDAVDGFLETPDNTLYTPGNQLSAGGISFYFGTAGDPPVGAANLFSAYGAPAPIGFEFDSQGIFSIGYFTAVAAPEPSQVVSMLSLAGMGGAGLLLKLRRRN